MNIDLIISEWIVQFYFLSNLAELFGGRIFSGVLVLGLGIYFYKIKRLKIFLFICISTGFGDFFGNILKDLFDHLPKDNYKTKIFEFLRKVNWHRGFIA